MKFAKEKNLKSYTSQGTRKTAESSVAYLLAYSLGTHTCLLRFLSWGVIDIPHYSVADFSEDNMEVEEDEMKCHCNCGKN